jgi:hypothetical protein
MRPAHISYAIHAAPFPAFTQAKPANHWQAFEIIGESPVNFQSISPDFPKPRLAKPLKSLAEKNRFTRRTSPGIVWSW